MPTITVSFKQTTRDIRLYTSVVSLEDRSDFIRDAIEFYLNHLEKEKIENGVR